MPPNTGGNPGGVARQQLADVAQTRTTILIVEDNRDNLSIYTTILEYSGYRVLSAEDGVTGLALARSARPDLIIMDVSIPGIDGWEVTRTLKGDATTSSIPILVLTAHALTGDRDRAYMEGADGYVSKPADPTAVVLEIGRLLHDKGTSGKDDTHAGQAASL